MPLIRKAPKTPTEKLTNLESFQNFIKKTPPAWLIEGSTIQFGEYKIVGEGSISYVFEAKLGPQTVAVKMLKTEDDISGKGFTCTSIKQIAADFNKELNAISLMFDHPNIEQFIGAGTTKYQGKVHAFIVYEFLGGGCIEAVYDVENRKLEGEVYKPPKTLALSYCCQLLSALHYLHTFRTPIAHRDIKPANCILSTDGKKLKLADFSLSCPFTEKPVDFSGAPSVAGSLRYMSPEASQPKPFDLEKSDIYSAAMTVYFIFYGQRPFAEYESETAQTMASQGIRPPVTAELSKVLSPAWDFKPANRPSAEAFSKHMSALRRTSVSG